MNTAWTTVVVLLLVNPLAERAVSDDADDDVRERLIRQAQGHGEEDVMDKIMAEMLKVESALKEHFDIGIATLEHQDLVIKRLDEAIEIARKNLRQSKSSSAQPQAGDKRDQGEASEDGQANSGSLEESGESGTAGQGEGEQAQRPTRGELLESRRQWGALPPRDRDEILQGIEEDVHEAFTEQVDRYYEALADPEID
jgi:hypothetical protein